MSWKNVHSVNMLSDVIGQNALYWPFWRITSLRVHELLFMRDNVSSYGPLWIRSAQIATESVLLSGSVIRCASALFYAFRPPLHVTMPVNIMSSPPLTGFSLSGKSGNLKVTGKSGNFSFCRFQFSSDVRCNYKEVEVGVAATKVLSMVKLSDLERMGFRKQYIDFLSSMTAKIIERSPLKYPLVRVVSCFVPSTILNNRSLAETRLRGLLQILFTTNHINAATADNSKCQFSSLRD